MVRSSDRKMHFVWSVVVVFLIQLPLLFYNMFGIGSLVAQLIIFLIVAITVGAIYIGLVKTLRADKQEPLPWYASPVVWLGLPIAIVTLYILIP